MLKWSACDGGWTAMIKASSNTYSPLASADWQLRRVWALSFRHLKCSHLIFHKLIVRAVKIQHHVGYWLGEQMLPVFQQQRHIFYCITVMKLHSLTIMQEGSEPPHRTASFHRLETLQNNGFLYAGQAGRRWKCNCHSNCFQRHVSLSSNIKDPC